MEQKTAVSPLNLPPTIPKRSAVRYFACERVPSNDTHFLSCCSVVEVAASNSEHHFSATLVLVPQTRRQRANVLFLTARSSRMLESSRVQCHSSNLQYRGVECFYSASAQHLRCCSKHQKRNPACFEIVAIKIVSIQ